MENVEHKISAFVKTVIEEHPEVFKDVKPGEEYKAVENWLRDLGEKDFKDDPELKKLMSLMANIVKK